MTNDCICSNVPRIWRLAGVTRTVRLTVTKDGSPYDFTGLQTVLRIDRDNSDFHYEPQFTVEGDDNNIIVFTWAADKQPLGDYTIEVAVTDGSGNMDRVNWHGATGVRLVEYSNLVKGEDAAGVESDSELGLDGIFTMNGTGMSAYDEWLAQGHTGTEADYIAWMQQPAREAASDAEAAMIVIQARADEDHATAESDHTTAGNDHTRAAQDHTTAVEDHEAAIADHTQAGQDHERAETDHTTAQADHVTAGNDHTLAAADHATAASDHSTAASDHTKATQDSTRAGSDHDIAVADHAQAEADHTRAEGDHTLAAADHTTAASDHTIAASDHTTAAADHTQAVADHAVMAGYDTRLTNVETDVTQLGQEVNGYDETVVVSAETSLTGYGINQANGLVTNAARTDYSVKVYKMVFGKSYHIAIPKLTNAYTAAYSFMNNSDAASPISRYSILPSPVVKGPLTNYEATVTAPSETLVNLLVCYETAYGAPTVTTTNYVEGLTDKVETLEGDVETLEGDVETLEDTVANIITDTDDTQYENEGQIAYYNSYGAITGWYGTGTSTPALASDVQINTIIFPPFRCGNTAVVQYYIGHRVYSAERINTPATELTKLAEGSIENVGTTYITGYTVRLTEPVTIPSGHQIIVLLYCQGVGYVYILGGGTSETEVAPYNSDDARAFLITTSGLNKPFEELWGIATGKTSAQYKVCNPVLKYVMASGVKQLIEEEVPEIVSDIVPEIVDEILQDKDKVEVYLPNKLYAVVGDALQLFFQGIVGVVNIADYDIYVECSKGRTYPRYFHYKPTADDIGTTTLTVYVKDRNNNILGQASCDLVTVSAPSSPVSAKSIFTFGDSLTSQGQWPGEAKRRLVGNSTYDSIAGKGLSNIAFYGYMNKTINGQSVDYFGVGGWTWANYLTKSAGGAFRFYVSGVSSLSIGAVYTNNGYSYTVQEINITGDSGNIRCTTSANTNTPSASGTLTKTSGDGDATITFASYETENVNPLWDDTNNKVSFVPYAQDCGASTIDAVYVLLSWNGQGSWKDYSVNDTTGHIANAKTFARTLHTEYPSAKLFIMGLQMPSDTGGLGYNYGASGGLIDGQGVKQTAFNYNKALQDLCNLDEFSPYCEFVAIAPQFDSHYNMPYNNVKVNIRNAVTEMLGTNGVHPSDAGYFQIADAVYRSIVANFCQLS